MDNFIKLCFEKKKILHFTLRFHVQLNFEVGPLCPSLNSKIGAGNKYDNEEKPKRTNRS